MWLTNHQSVIKALNNMPSKVLTVVAIVGTVNIWGSTLYRNLSFHIPWTHCAAASIPIQFNVCIAAVELIGT